MFASSYQADVRRRGADHRGWALRRGHPADRELGEHKWSDPQVAGFCVLGPWIVEEHRDHCTVVLVHNVRNGAVVEVAFGAVGTPAGVPGAVF